MKKEELRGRLGPLIYGLDSYWRVMHSQDVAESTRAAVAGQYQGIIFTICALGGEWVRDGKGKHRVFLMGASSRNIDEYKEED